MQIADYLVISMFLVFICIIVTGIPIAYCLAGTGIFSASWDIYPINILAP